MQNSTVFNIEPLGFQWKAYDPFLFCVHHNDNFPAGKQNQGPKAEMLHGRNIGNDFTIKDGWRMYHGQQIPGFPVHPHRGFETVTVVRKGMVDHSDSLGACGRYGNGDVQWMTAGKGIQHAEMFPLINQDKNNPLELFQIWLNLPQKDKFVEPHFKMLWAGNIPVYVHEHDYGIKTTIEIIAGNIENQKAPSPAPCSWAADTNNNIAIWNIQMDAGAQWTLPTAKQDTTRTLYFYNGDGLLAGGTEIPKYYMARLDAAKKITLKCKNTSCKILLLQGKPINEPIVQHGPFVMNTREEIQQAFNDYRQTQFGGWPWLSDEPVHAIESGRFSKHADGKVEKPL